MFAVLSRPLLDAIERLLVPHLSCCDICCLNITSVVNCILDEAFDFTYGIGVDLSIMAEAAYSWPRAVCNFAIWIIYCVKFHKECCASLLITIIERHRLKGNLCKSVDLELDPVRNCPSITAIINNRLCLRQDTTQVFPAVQSTQHGFRAVSNELKPCLILA